MDEIAPVIVRTDEKSAETAKPKRLAHLDLFRGVFVCVMIDAHVTNALVRAPYSLTAFAFFHQKTFNIAAPGFLFAAGISFGMSLARQWQDYRLGQLWRGRTLRRRFARVGEILLFGYLLHTPHATLSKMAHQTTPRQLAAFLGMDILQCIGYTSIAILALAWLCRRAQYFAPACIAMAILIAVFGPFAWRATPDLPWWIVTTFNKRLGSNFPLFPYSAFEFAGASCGWYFARNTQNLRAFFVRLWQWAFPLVIVGGLGTGLLVRLSSGAVDRWEPNPFFFVFRVGILLFLFVGCYFGQAGLMRWAPFLLPLGQESLLVYIAHLMVVYGSLLNPETNLHKLYEGRVSSLQALAIFVLLTATMTLIGLAWHRTKNRSGSGVAWAEGVLLASGFVLFVSL